jgi:hypothetical protein
LVCLRASFPVSLVPKIKDEHNLPYTKGQSVDLADLRDMAYSLGRTVTRRDYGEDVPGLYLDFDSIESFAVDLGQAVTWGAIEDDLKIRERSMQLAVGSPGPSLTLRHDVPTAFACRQYPSSQRLVSRRFLRLKWDSRMSSLPTGREEPLLSPFQLATGHA